MEVASLIVSPLLQVIYENLASYLSTLETSKGQKKNIKKLQDKLRLIQAVIEDAEERQLKDKKVKIWLSKLRDVAYDADDLLDEITTKVLQRQLLKEKWVVDEPVKSKLKRLQASIYEETRRQVRITSFTLQSILSSFETSRKLTEIVKRLDDIATEMSTFQFKEVVAYKRSDTIEKRETGPYVDESQVYGRTQDMKKIVDLLLSSDASTWVISIVGIGGIGKTTLAQLVYNDQSLDGHFDMKIWVSLYDKFSSKNLLSEILECVTKHRCESFQMGFLQSQLQESLCGKRYLLVLDDVWNDDQEEWDKVRNLLKCGAEGSKIIVTTRTQKVASVISSTPPYFLEALTKDDCWTLFKQQAFLHGEEASFSNLLPIGRQIIDKCQGVPLAAKVLGGLLRFKREEHEWLRVQESDLWNLDAGENRILSVLRLSFNHLPSHLKRCFAYCAIFPRNYHLNKEKLIQQWIAGGLVQLSAGDDPNNLEHIGNECFNNLLKMSFFQLASSSNVEEFKVSNLIYDLAKYVAGKEFLTITNSYQAQVVAGGDLAETRHALVDSNYRSNLLPETLYKAHKLCTLNLLAYGDISMESLRNLVSHFGHLKILNLSGSGIKRMHRSIGDLIYLRYLDLSNTALETLPETIGHLCNLQTLELSGCTDLLELPKEIIKLVKLRHLNIRDCTRLARLPDGICYLEWLQTLPIFIARGHIFMLNKLTFLRGELKIKHLENACVARGARYLLHIKLQTLGLFWGDTDEGKLNQNTSRQTRQGAAYSIKVLECLQPNCGIRILSINGYPGRQFPIWMINPDAINNLTELELINCKSCETLPRLGQLPVLKFLNIQGMDNVVKIGNDFYGEGMGPFPSLNELKLRDFPELRIWESMSSTGAFPCLERLSIMKCPLLKTMPWFPTLQHLIVQNCDPLLLRSAAELRTLATLVQHMKMLQNLEIRSCPNLMALPKVNNLVSLRSLDISDCQNIQSLPEGIQQLSELQHLSIQNCPELEKRCKRGEGEDWQKISHIPYVYIGTSILQNSQDTAASTSSS